MISQWTTGRPSLVKWSRSPGLRSGRAPPRAGRAHRGRESLRRRTDEREGGRRRRMTDREASIEPSERVRDYTDRFRRFLDEEVVPVESSLADAGVGTPSQPRHDHAGRMHAARWEARREVQRRAGAAGLYAPHIGTRFEGWKRASPGWRCTTSRSSSTGPQASAWVWPPWPGPRVQARRANTSPTWPASSTSCRWCRAG